MTAQLPALLALLGAALMAIVLLAPAKPGCAAPEPPAPVVEVRRELQWPALVDPCAAGCSVATRLALVAALAALQEPWADAILAHARAEETEPAVRLRLGARAAGSRHAGTGADGTMAV